MATSTEMQQQIQNANFKSRQGWRKVRFDQMADAISDRVDNPSEADVEYYVGLEHLDPESLKIKRWGTPDDVEATKLRFKPGDIIFGRRRAYQRKLAVAEFEGICSAHALVLRAKEETVLKEFLPFFMQSETFFERAMAISVGSLSPTINWKTLAQQEFIIPPKDEQRRIAEILWAVDEVMSHYKVNVKQSDTLMRRFLTELTTKGISHTSYKETMVGHIPEGWSVHSIGGVLEMCQYGLSIPLNQEGQFPIFRMMNIEDGVIVERDMKYVDLLPNQLDAYKLEKGDILFNRTNSIDLVGKLGIYRLDGCHVFASYLIRLRVFQDIILPEYLNYYLNSDLGQKRILAYATPGVSQSNINANNLKKVLIPLPSLSEQSQIITLLRQLEDSKTALNMHVLSLYKLKHTLLTKLFN